MYHNILCTVIYKPAVLKNKPAKLLASHVFSLWEMIKIRITKEKKKATLTKNECVVSLHGCGEC